MKKYIEKLQAFKIKIFPNLPKHIGVKIFGLVIILIAIPITVHLTNNIVKYFSKADVPAEKTTNIYLTSDKITLFEGETANITVKVDTYNEKATFLRVVVVFNNSLINLSDEITVDPVWWVVRKSTKDEANSTGRIELALAYPPDTVPPTLVYNVANFNVTPMTPYTRTVELSFDNSDMQVIYETGLTANISTVSQTITLNPCLGCIISQVSTPECLLFNEQTNLLCGSGGEPCHACSEDQTCIEGVCVNQMLPLTPTVTPTPTHKLSPTPTSSPIIQPTNTPTPTSSAATPTPTHSCVCRNGTVRTNNCGSYQPVCTSKNSCRCE